ncbi:hypothetical protein HGB25_02215 [Candidatus Saccharibacteria bacterium]|nr:hypothetical protein [Candidatus Saccharibacteria bacterium]
MNIYFSGIGGVGIGPLAEIALDMGHNIIGSDPVESLMTSQLRARKVNISNNQDGDFLNECHNESPIDWYVHTAALPDDHPELTTAKRLGIKTAKRDKLLAHLIEEKNLKLIAIAGTHGKTTTTGMMIWLLQQLNIPISYSIGTTIPFGPSGKYNPASEYFIYECDEFDRNFLNFKPFLSLITTVDYDHPDTYKTSEDYLQAFHQFAQQSDQIITWSDQHSEIYNDILNKQILEPDQVASDLTLPGAHNRRNATLVQNAIKTLGLAEDTTDALNNFPGVNRRFEKLSDNLYSDYGHHPVEIVATLQMARELSDHVSLIYQPHQNIRQHEIVDQYTDQFELAEKIYWLPTYLSREDPGLTILKPDDLIQKLTNHDDVTISELDEKLWQAIQADRKSGMLVIGMGAGSIDGWLRSNLEQEQA